MKITKTKLIFLVFILIISFISPVTTLSYNIDINYTSMSKNHVWQNPVNAGQISGSTGKCTPLKGIKVNLIKDSNIKGDIYYSVYSKKYGWTKYVSSGNVAGNLNNNIEAIKIKLTGDLEKNYNIFYRAHIQDYGWLAWARNDDIAGSLDANLRLEAIQIRLIKNDVVPTTIMLNRSLTPAIINEKNSKITRDPKCYNHTFKFDKKNDIHFFKPRWLDPNLNWSHGINENNCENACRGVALYRIFKFYSLDKLTVKSQLAHVMLPDGSISQGNYMDKSCLSHSPGYYKNYKITGEFQKNINSLQILDSICCQSDRHCANYFIKTCNSKYIDVQSFDNELCFGKKVNLKESVSVLPAIVTPNNLITLPHMDKKLATNILNTTDNQIRAALFDILEKEYIDSTINRLHQLQVAIKNSIKKVPNFLLNENEWNDKTIKEELDSKYYSYLKLFRDKINEP